MRGAQVAIVAAALGLVSCKRSPAAATASLDAAVGPAFNATVVDGGARDAVGEGSWACEEDPATAHAMPAEPIVGTLAFPGGSGAPLFTFVASEGGRKHRAWVLAEPLRAVEGPSVTGDAPPWVGAFEGDAPRFVHLEVSSPARVVVRDGVAAIAEVPIALGDELAVDAAGSGASFVVAASTARGVEVRVGSGAKAASSFVIDDAYAPAVLFDARGTASVAARVDAALEQAKPTKEVPTANLEGAGQERVGSSLVVVGPGGKRLAAHAIPAGAEVLGVTAGREVLVVASARVTRGARAVDVDAIRPDGRRERVGEFAVRRGARLFPVAGRGAELARAVLEVFDDGVAVLGAREGALPLRDVEAAFGVRDDGESLVFWALRERDGARSLGPVRCAWRAR